LLDEVAHLLAREDRRGELGLAMPRDEHLSRAVDPDLLDLGIVEIALQRPKPGDDVDERLHCCVGVDERRDSAEERSGVIVGDRVDHERAHAVRVAQGIEAPTADERADLALQDRDAVHRPLLARPLSEIRTLEDKSLWVLPPRPACGQPRGSAGAARAAYERTNRSRFSSEDANPAWWSSAEIASGTFSAQISTCVPPATALSRHVVVMGSANAGSSESNTPDWTTSSPGTSSTKLPSITSASALDLPGAPEASSYVSTMRYVPPGLASKRSNR